MASKAAMLLPAAAMHIALRKVHNPMPAGALNRGTLHQLKPQGPHAVAAAAHVIYLSQLYHPSRIAQGIAKAGRPRGLAPPAPKTVCLSAPAPLCSSSSLSPSP